MNQFAGNIIRCEYMCSTFILILERCTELVHSTRVCLLFTRLFWLCLQTLRPRLSRALAAPGRRRSLQHVWSGWRECRHAAARVQVAVPVPGAGADAGWGQRRELRRVLVRRCGCGVRWALHEIAARALLWYAYVWYRSAPLMCTCQFYPLHLICSTVLRNDTNFHV